MDDKKLDKIEKFIQDREKLTTSPVPNSSSNAPVFVDKNPKIKQLNNVPKEVPTVIKGSTPKINTKEVTKLSPDRFKKVQADLAAKSSIKKKLHGAIKAGDKDAAKYIIEQVHSVAEKTGDTHFLSELVKRVSKSKLAKKIGKKALSVIPLAGGVISALASGDIKAAVPGLDAIDSLGPEEGSEDHMIESGNYSPEFLEKLKKEAAAQKRRQ